MAFPTISICVHCKSDCGKNKYCEYCTTKELRTKILRTYPDAKLAA